MTVIGFAIDNMHRLTDIHITFLKKEVIQDIFKPHSLSQLQHFIMIILGSPAYPIGVCYAER